MTAEAVHVPVLATLDDAIAYVRSLPVGSVVLDLRGREWVRRYPVDPPGTPRSSMRTLCWLLRVPAGEVGRAAREDTVAGWVLARQVAAREAAAAGGE